MKIDVTKLRIEEVGEIAARLERLNMHTCFSIIDGRALLLAASVPAAQNYAKEIDKVAW